MRRIGKKNLIKHVFNRIKKQFDHLYWSKILHSIGKTSIIERPVSIVDGKDISIGERCDIRKNCQMQAIKEYGDKEFSPMLSIGDDFFCGQNTHIVATGSLRIGNGVTISDNVFVTDCYHEYADYGKSVLRQPLSRCDTEIGDACFIGYGAVIEAGVRLGKVCVVGSNAVVLRGDYPDGTVLVGVPAIQVKKYDNKTRQWKGCPKS